MLIGEHAFQYQNLFAAAVGMPLKLCIGGVAHKAGSASNFITNPVKHHALYPRAGGIDPLILFRGNTGKVAKIGV